MNRFREWTGLFLRQRDLIYSRQAEVTDRIADLSSLPLAIDPS